MSEAIFSHGKEAGDESPEGLVASSGSAPASILGVCSGCGCTEQDACYDEANGLPCHWVTEGEDWCSVCALNYGSIVIEIGRQLRAQGQVRRLVL